jgi:hypothetical protein
MTKGAKSRKAKDVVHIPIYNCQDCKHCDRSRYYTADSFEHVEAWNCASPKLRCKYKGRNGTTDNEAWHEPPGIGLVEGRDKPSILRWCPLRKVKLP